jgi:hypothetical protein
MAGAPIVGDLTSATRRPAPSAAENLYRLIRGSQTEIRNAARDTSSSAEVRVEVAFAAQLLVRRYDGSARHAKVSGESARGWKARARHDHAVDDISAQTQIDTSVSGSA